MSPLIFAICLNVLIEDIDKAGGNEVFAYVDDMSVYAKRSGGLRGVMSRIDDFTCLSGLGINRDKTAFMSARHDAHLARLLREGLTSWGKMDYVEKYKYLGVWTGPAVTLQDVYEGPVAEIGKRLRLYKDALLSLTPHAYKRILVYNIHVFPLLSYVAEFHPIPLRGEKGAATFETVRDLVRRYLLPFGGLKYVHAIAVEGVRPPIAVKDAWAYSIAVIAARVGVGSYNGVDKVKATVARDPSLRMSVQDEQVTSDFVAWALYLARPGVDVRKEREITFDASPFNGNPRLVRKAMYTVLVKAHVKVERAKADLRAK